MSQVHVAVTRRARPGREKEFEAALREFARQSLHVPGTTGVLLLAPVPGDLGHEFGILRSFENEAARDAFYESPLFLQWLEHSAEYSDDEANIRPLHGLEAFFRDSSHQPPPRWKMAILTWLGVFPSVVLWSAILPGILPPLHPLAMIFATTVLVVITLAWGVMPLLTRLFSSWLRRSTIF